MSNSLCSLPGSSVHGILQARILEWVAIAFSRGFSWARDWTQVSCIAGRFFFLPSAQPGKPLRYQKVHESRHIVTSAELFIFILTTCNARSYFIYIYIHIYIYIYVYTYIYVYIYTHIYIRKEKERVFKERSEITVTRFFPLQAGVPSWSHVSLAACASLWKCCSQQATARMPFSAQNCLPGTSKQRKGAPSWRGSVSGISESPSLGWSPHLLSGSDHFCLVCGNPAD